MCRDFSHICCRRRVASSSKPQRQRLHLHSALRSFGPCVRFWTEWRERNRRVHVHALSDRCLSDVVVDGRLPETLYFQSNVFVCYFCAFTPFSWTIRTLSMYVYLSRDYYMCIINVICLCQHVTFLTCLTHDNSHVSY